MEIAKARAKAHKMIEGRVIPSLARRPTPGARVMFRLTPQKLVLADTPEEIEEKVARHLQYQARKSGRNH